MKSADFFLTHPVFTKDEFVAGLGKDKPRTRESQLDYFVKRGRLRRVRRGLYATVAFSPSSPEAAPDPFLIAAKQSQDAVLAYHTALAFQGKAHSHRNVMTVLTTRRLRPLSFGGFQFRAVPFPRSLKTQESRLFGVREVDRHGLIVRVTSLERTLVDLLDRPDLAGGWEETWRSLESVEYFDLEVVTEYALVLRNSTTIAKTGFFLEQHRETLMVEEKHLEQLRRHRPRGRHYLSQKGRGDGRLVPGWNLIVPQTILDRAWQEVP